MLHTVQFFDWCGFGVGLSACTTLLHRRELDAGAPSLYVLLLLAPETHPPETHETHVSFLSWVGSLN